MSNHQGEFCGGRNIRRKGEISVFEAESCGVLEAIKWTTELGIFNVEIENDSLMMLLNGRRCIILR